MRGWARALLILGVLIGFGPLALALIVGCMMIPLQVEALAIQKFSEGSTHG